MEKLLRFCNNHVIWKHGLNVSRNTAHDSCIRTKSHQQTYRTFTNSTTGVPKSYPQCHQKTPISPYCRRYSSLSRRDLLNVNKEFRAFTSILTRSGLGNRESISRLLGIGAVRLFHTSRACYQQDKEDDKDDKEKEEEKLPLLPRLFIWFWLFFALYTGMRFLSGEDNNVYKYVSWNEFVHDMLAKGEVEEVIIRPEIETAMIKLHPGAMLKGRRAESNTYTMKLPDVEKFEDKLRAVEDELGIKAGQGVPISYQRTNSWAGLAFVGIVALAVFLVLRSVVKVSMPNPTDMFAGARKAKFVRVDLQTAQGKGINFKDVAGLKEAKIEVMEFVDYLKRPEKYKELGGKIPHGALLLGPPGCGKTLLAKAVATEAKVPFLAMAGSEFVEMLGGLGAARVRDLFKEARNRSPCIVYIDEIDAIGRKRSGGGGAGSGGGGGGGNSEEEHTLNQLLVEMDGMSTTDGVIMLGSTNRPDVLDKALLRPGRFDRHIDIDLPTLIERKEIFEIYLQKIVLKGMPSDYTTRLAHLSPGMSGADIANICNEAALHAARDGKTAVAGEDFEYAIERVIAGQAKRSRVLAPEERRIVAFHESGHALVGWLLKHTDALLRVSIVPRTSAALGFAQYMPSDQKLYSSDELFERMCMALGGRVAESLTFNKVTTGAQDDLKRVTQMAYAQIQSYGMNKRVGQVSFPSQQEIGFGSKPFSKKLASIIDEEATHMITTAYKATEELLLNNTDSLKLIAETLLEKEVLTYNDMEHLIGPPPHGPKKLVSLPEFDVIGTPAADAKSDSEKS